MAESKVTTQKKASKPKSAPTEKAPTKEKTLVKKAAAPKKTTLAKTASKKTKPSTADLEQRYRMIEIAAYFIAEKDGFASNPFDYWLAAEAEINQSGK
jgi:hypothetical protein